MRKVEQHIVRDDRYVEICTKAKNLYNQCLYYWRQTIFKKIEYFTENELSSLMQEFNDESFRALPANTSQQVIKFLFLNIKSWIKAKKEYNKNPSIFREKPKIPKYKKHLSQVYFTSNQVRLKNGYIHFPKKSFLEPIKTKLNNISCCRIIPKRNHFVVEFIYTVDDKEVKEYNGKWLSIDVGLNNLATCTSNSTKHFIINGKPMKAINNFYNKRKRQLQIKLKTDSYTSNRINRLTFRRNQKIKDYIHKASRKIVEIANDNGVTKIIIGKNKNWKQSLKLGRKNNRQFTSIPHATLIDKINYKAQLYGISVVTTQEAYTSKCSAIDLEPIKKHDKYVGKRVKRGVFLTATGVKINADVNGSLNIARIVLGDDAIKHNSIMSCMAQPIKINLF